VADLGRNLLDLRLSTRIAILNLIFARGGMSRKDIAAALNLTPGAITVITGALIEEGVLHELRAVEGSNRLGRREVILDLRRRDFRVMCAFFGNQEARITCVNFAGEIDYIKSLYFAEGESGDRILGATADAFLEYMEELEPGERRGIVGAGLGVRGVYDTVRGVSVSSIGLWEDGLPVRAIMEEKLGMKVLAINNISCVINAELMFHHGRDIHSMVLLRYGPMVGSALVLSNFNYSGYRYRSMEIAHTIVDPLGAECRCGKRGCLETRVGFDAIAAQLNLRYSKADTPILYRLTGGSRGRISMRLIMESYDRGEPIVCRVVEGAMDHLALAIVNLTAIIDPERIVLYGMPFESDKYMAALKDKVTELSAGDAPPDMERSSHNLYLEDVGCASTVIKDFLNHGAKYDND
jgi:predicted NBD/HSP70 family sugar kinase